MPPRCRSAGLAICSQMDRVSVELDIIEMEDPLNSAENP
jgi:hypothetical protein